MSDVQLFTVKIIDSRTQNSYFIVEWDEEMGWQTADKISLFRNDWKPMGLTVSQVHHATKWFKDCASGKYRTIEVQPL